MIILGRTNFFLGYIFYHEVLDILLKISLTKMMVNFLNLIRFKMNLSETSKMGIFRLFLYRLAFRSGFTKNGETIPSIASFPPDQRHVITNFTSQIFCKLRNPRYAHSYLALDKTEHKCRNLPYWQV